MFERDGDKSLKEDLIDYGYSFTSSEWKKFDDKIKSDILMNFRLAYLTDGDVNWCEELGTVLANDEIIKLAMIETRESLENLDSMLEY